MEPTAVLDKSLITHLPKKTKTNNNQSESTAGNSAAAPTTELLGLKLSIDYRWRERNNN